MNNEKYFWIDFTKSIAAFAVIILHICAPIVSDFSNSETWWTGNVYNSITRFSVPIFVMISGTLLLGKDEDLLVFLKKRFLRIFFPFVFWSIIYLLLKTEYQASISEIISKSIRYFRGGTEYHLWYIYMILGLYFFVPILRKFTVNAKKQELIYFLIIWFAVALLNFPVFSKLYTKIDLRYFSGYIGYLILGFYLVKFPQKNDKKIAGFLLVLSLLVTIFFSYIYSEKAQKFNSTFYDFLSANVILLSASVFILFKNLTITNVLAKKIISEISKYSYGIYLSHVLILIILDKIGFTYHNFNAWFSIPIMALVTLVLSYLIVVIISKIPFLGKHISGA